LGGADDVAGAGGVEGEGFLAEDVLAGLESGDGLLGVKGGGDAEVHEVNVGVGSLYLVGNILDAMREVPA